jgi:hypothetical protein
MRIKSNDSTSIELIIPLTATPIGWEAPEDTGAANEDTGEVGEDTGATSN